MTTRAQDFQSDQVKRHSGKRAVKARAKAKTRAEHQAKAKLDHKVHATHNQAPRARRSSSYELERGTRKSTRLAANRVKPDSSLRKTVMARNESPKARFDRK
jgi:hypothetical protein